MTRAHTGGTIARIAVVVCLFFLSAFPCNGESGKSDPAPVQDGKAKNVILFIGDGMGFEQVKAAGMYASGESGTLSFESFPYTGSISTNDAEGRTTDSAAAATAMATGVKVPNGVIAMEIRGSGRPVETILEHYKAKGKWTGLVTTTFIAHATPAAFAAHTPRRDDYDNIVSDYLRQSRPNILFGGGKYISGDAARRAGYTVVVDRAGLMALDDKKETMVAGLFGEEHMPFETDGPGLLPSLSDMTRVALRILGDHPGGFFLMVEGGRIDHACHANDISRAVSETVEFSNAVAGAIGWSKGRTDTLILVTADHETGGLRVLKNNGAGVAPTVSWSSADHTPQNVPVYAWGPNVESISGTHENTHIFTVIKQASGGLLPAALP
jgi:alkaline phosphatase